jgi:glycosyltransferase involved in cell wall biosynthesis
MIQHEKTGLKFEPGNAEDMIRQLNRMLEEPELTEKLSLQANATSESTYLPEQNYQQLMSIY